MFGLASLLITAPLTTLASIALLGAPALASDWVVDREASSVEFEATAFNSPVSGEFGEFSADITLDPDDLENARIDAVVRTASGAMGNSDYQSALRAGDGLAPGDHPEARFTSSDIRAVEAGYEAHGVLTIKGVESDVVLPFSLEITGDRAVADGRFTVNRSTFGVGESGWGDVGAQVEIIVHIEADRAAETAPDAEAE